MSHDDIGRDWTDVAVSQGIPMIISKLQKAKKGKEGSPYF
jgi:hypothetical protein